MSTIDLALIIGGVIVTAAIGANTALALLPENRHRRTANKEMRDLDRAKRRRHIHQWTKWSAPQRMPVYPNGKSSDNSLPIRYDLNQVRECHDCGMQEWHTESI